MLDQSGEIRRLLAKGDLKVALGLAKAAHKAKPDKATEELLVDVYSARIRQLAAMGLQHEASALAETVRAAYPASTSRLQPPSKYGWLKPLADPDLDAPARAAIERRIATEVDNLADLASASDLPVEHPLRVAAATLRDALVQVTTGPAKETPPLNEVSRRSPLAAWKSLVGAIGAYYRGEDEACERFARAIPADSAVAPLVPALLSLVGRGDGRTPQRAAALAEQISPSRRALQKLLLELDDALGGPAAESKVLKLITKAVAECDRVAPSLSRRLQQYVSVRCAMVRMSSEKVRRALGAPAHKDSFFHRLVARGMEVIGCGVDAAVAWENFRKSALEEKLFQAGTREGAMLDIQIARALVNHTSTLPAYGRRSDFDPIFYFSRACSLDPCAENFEHWLNWASGYDAKTAEGVAYTWRSRCKGELRPVLFLMEVYEKRNALQKATKELARAEEIDSVNPAVRAARMRLMIKILMRHIKDMNIRLVTKDLAEIEELPHARHGDMPGMLCAMRFYAWAEVRETEAAVALAELERAMGPVAGPVLLQAVGLAMGLRSPRLPPDVLTADEMAELPSALVRLHTVAQSVGLPIALHTDVLEAAHRAYVEHRPKMDVAQLKALNQMALMDSKGEFAYAVSATGLAMGGPSEARFLMYRAKSVPGHQFVRASKCLAAALALARETRDTDTINEVLRTRPTGVPEIDPDTLALVRKSEREAVQFPAPGSPGPSYEASRPKFDPSARGPSLYDEVEDDDLEAAIEELFEDEDETGPPREIRRMLEELMREMERAARSGDAPPRGRRRRRRRSF